jgi:hypothetical protein
MFSTTNWPAETKRPWYGCGATTPCAVRNERFTAAGDAPGLKSARVRVLPGAVEPPANAHCEEISEAQGAIDQPAAPESTWSALTPPPAKENEEAVDPAGNPSAGLTAVVPSGGTVTECRAVAAGPPVDAATVVIDPTTGRAVVLVR